MHRWVWDLRYTTPTATAYEYPISAVPHATPRVPQGALALPGTYTVRLKADGRAFTAPLVVKMDPRVEATPADLEALFTLESSLAHMVSSTSEASLESHSIAEQVDKLLKTTQPPLPSPIKESVASLSKAIAQLQSGDESPGKDEPGLDEVAGTIEGLYAQVGNADAPPTNAQQQAAKEASEHLQGPLHQWQELKSKSIPELNQQLRAAHLTELNLEQQPATMPEGGDED
jgi:hypothetical protein